METSILDKFMSSTGICTDTRSLSTGNLFIALKGDNFNGNNYAKYALEQGASFAVIDEVDQQLDDRMILVEDCLQTLQKLANEYRWTFDIPILAITGTNGKTTTKELITQVLKQEYKTHSTQGNLNNHIGVPLTLLSMPRDTEIGVIEMGANHIGEIMDLCEIAEPTHGIITNIGRAHLEGFGSIEGVIQAKTDMNRFLIKQGGTLFINGDDSLLMSQELPKTIIQYGNSEDSFLNFRVSHNQNPYASIDSHGIVIGSNLIGSYNCINIAAASCIGKYFKIEMSDIKDAIETYTPNNKRSQHLTTDKNQIILDAYNANPSSMEAAILDFQSIAHLDKLLILGDMFELGPNSQKEHQSIVDLITSYKLSAVLIGKEFSKTSHADNIQKFVNCDQFIDQLNTSPLINKYVLLKGSRGMALEQLVKYI